MLRRFSYLDTSALDQYISALENGLVSEETRRTMNASGTGAASNAKGAESEDLNTRERETAQTLADNPPARFDRLLKAAKLQPEALGWIEVTNPDADFEGVERGAMISWECDLSTPEFVQMLSRAGEAAGALRAMSRMLPDAQRLGLDTQRVPDSESIDAMTSLISGMDIQAVIVGDSEDTDWQVFARLSEDFVLAELDGPMRIVGKVTRVVSKGSRHPLVNLPGSQLGSREERRARAKQRPAEGQEGQTIEGPAIELALLAAFI